MMKSAIAAAVVGVVLSGGHAMASEGRAGSWHNSAQGSPDLNAAKKAVEKNPSDAIANNDLGWAFRQNGDNAQAEKYLRQAVKLKPTLSQAHCNLSVVLLDKGAVDEAQSEANKAVTIDGASPIYRVVLGNTWVKKGDRKSAIGQYKEAVRLKPDYENAQYNLGKTLLEDGQTNDAKFALAEAEKLDPNDDRVLKLLDKIAPHQ